MLYKIINRKQFSVTDGFHPKDSLLILLTGRFACTISGKSYLAGAGDIFVFNKKSPFTRNVLEEINCIYLQFDSFPVALADGLLSAKDNVRKENTIFHLKQAVLDKNEEMISHFVSDLLLMRREILEKKDSSFDPIVSACMDMFSTAYAENIDLESLSARLNISKQWLIRKFKAATHTTPIEYLNGLRINKAKNFLIDTDLPMGEIAGRCGYDNPYYFSNAFKKVVGISPLAYRNRFRI